MVYFIYEPDFGTNLVEWYTFIVWGFYGFRLAGAYFHKLPARTMRDIVFNPVLFDPETYMKPEVKPYGYKKYAYVTT